MDGMDQYTSIDGVAHVRDLRKKVQPAGHTPEVRQYCTFRFGIAILAFNIV